MHPFEMKEVRQALAYAINFEENAYVSLAESGVAIDCMCGFSDNLAPLWLSDDTRANLNPYSQDLELAEQMLLDIGFTRDDDGVWLDDTGARMEWNLTAPAEYSDWSAAAENAAEQLTAFGFKTSFRGVNFKPAPDRYQRREIRVGDSRLGRRQPPPLLLLRE